MKVFASVFCFIALTTSFVYGGDCPIPRNQLYIGPEIYHVHREKEGGSAQNGNMAGFRIGYDRIKRFNFYLGADFLYAQGHLRGKAGPNKIYSTLTDINLEERLGYTIESKRGMQPSITPFIGGGNFWENNHYKSPSPLKIHFNNSFSYFTAGFLSRLRVHSNLTVGVNFKIRYLLAGFTRVSHDPDSDNHVLNYDEKLQYRIELPVNYYFLCCSEEFSLGIVPFYEYRPYGHRANFPFDFLKTTYKIYGATFKFIYLF